MLGQNDASLRPDLPAFERFDTCERRPGRKTLDQQAKSGDPDVKRHATWGMSVKGRLRCRWKPILFWRTLAAATKKQNADTDFLRRSTEAILADHFGWR